MATNYSPTIVTDGAVFVGDARMPSISEPGTRVYNRAGVNSADVKLLIHGNVGSGQSFADSSLSNHTMTTGGQITHSATQSKFSGGSIYCDGSYDFLKIESSSVWVFDGDFTVDLWIYPQNSGSGGSLVGDYYIGGSSTSPDWQFLYNGTDQRMHFWRGSSIAVSSNSSVLRNQWSHVALVRSGTGSNNCKIYVNGTLDGQGTFTTDVGRGLNLWVGIDGNEISEPYLGYMDEVRITKGTALWTQNFTPPARRDTLSISDGMMYNGGCLDFDGTDDYISGASSLWSANGDQTFACWLKVDNISNSRLIFDTSGTGDFSVQTDGQIRVHPVASNWADTTSSISTGVWYHIVLTQTSTARKIYVDGVEQTLAVGAGSPQTVAWNSPTSALRIGHAGAYRDEFDGQMADARIYSAALSAANVKEIYNDSKVIIPSNVSQTNLKCWLSMVDGAGDYAYDGSGNGNDGTLTNMTSADWLTGQTGCPQLITGYNRPMLFDGSSNYVQVASDGSTDFANQSFTISAWINMPDVTPTVETVIFSYDYTAHSQPYYAMHVRFAGSSTGTLEFYWNNGSTLQWINKSSPPVTANTWHHIACTYTSGSQKIYIDGAEVASGTSTDTISFYNQEVWIGRANFGGYWGGLINETVVYNSALTLAQVQVLAATGPNGGPLPPDPMSLSNSSNVVGYWRNDGNVTWTDRSANSNTGTVYGSPDALLFKQGINGSASTSTGRDGQGFPLKYKDVGAIGFNGSSDYVNMADNSLWDATGGISVGCWCYADSLGSYNTTINQWDSSDNPSSSWTVETVGSDWRFYIYDSGSASLKYASSTGTAATGEWKYIVGVFDGITIKIYVDGVEGGTTGTVTTANTASFPLRLGRFYDTATGSWDGQIGNARIYNRFLSRAEIQQNYNAQKGRFT